tara:strand:+ start:115 stop:552 length:438 start_codon:yes stop_codon:yes gene_type:complete
MSEEQQTTEPKKEVVTETPKTDINALVEQLGKLTVVQAGELAKKLEEAWGLNYEQILGAGGGAGGPATSGTEEAKDTATVVLTGFAEDKKIAVLKKVREYVEMGLLEAKNFVENLPKNVKEDIEKDEAEKVKKALEEVGGTVQLK